MPSPFPGMNPYLEHPELWPEVHSRLIVAIADAIFPHLRPKYRVAIEKRVYQMTDGNSVLVGIPDVTIGRYIKATDKEPSNIAVASPPAKPITVNIPIPEEVRESYLEVREVGTGEVITVIELLSPKNKRPGEGRKAYDTKRQQVFGSSTHLVEIDLLRGGEPMPILGNQIQSDYRILVSRSELRPRAELYPFNLPEQIPTFVLPLRKGDTEPLLDLQSVIQDLFDRAGFDLAIDYSREPVPPIGEDDIVWVSELLK
ncbi:DUF4058 family protein [Calothrix sp. PCC 7507]|uniref:DUF4058 family protein n=1 Tax=Calothrix sp. PCC 7507 TaxID=99598 RepID=UPI00029F29E9|nr:DUF4058 family protein [Calothrix sp. PCC 7507]AFY32246.1 hypothetical protein Cal7507_1790 [Calothrix sp. PCC 7507]